MCTCTRSESEYFYDADAVAEPSAKYAGPESDAQCPRHINHAEDTPTDARSRPQPGDYHAQIECPLISLRNKKVNARMALEQALSQSRHRHFGRLGYRNQGRPRALETKLRERHRFVDDVFAEPGLVLSSNLLIIGLRDTSGTSRRSSSMD